MVAQKSKFLTKYLYERTLSPFTWKYGQEIVYHILTGYLGYLVFNKLNNEFVDFECA